MRITFNTAGFDELRKSPGVVKALEAKAAELAAAAGPGYEAEPVYMGRKRARVSVRAATAAARAREAREHRLIQALAQVKQ
jgi:hypothetical protein